MQTGLDLPKLLGRLPAAVGGSDLSPAIQKIQNKPSFAGGRNMTKNRSSNQAGGKLL